MLDLPRWHAAEEVAPDGAFDLAEQTAGGYAGRLVATAQVVPVPMALWLAGVVFLMRHEPARPGKATWGGYRRAVAAGEVAGPQVGPHRGRQRAGRGQHPGRDGSDQAAVAYLARFEAVPAVP
jgi:uncharacterized protein